MQKIRWYGPTLVLMLTVLVVLISGPKLVKHIAWAHEAAEIELIKDGLKRNPTLSELSNAFRQVARAVKPSVVHVQVYSRTPKGQSALGNIDPEELRRWFLDPDRQNTPLPRRDNDDDLKKYDVPQPSGNGSGWVYDEKGHIITNNHVVEGADKIVVRFKDGSEREAEILGTDPKTDVAVLKVKNGELHPATLGGEVVEQGDIVFAFGSPFGNDFSMSQGIVSGKGRQVGILRSNAGYENFIQTDAAINPGNSGGPLTNIRGEVIGMNSAIATRSGFSNGVGYAIPIRMVKRVADALIKDGKVHRGYLGIVIDPLDPKLARTFGYDGKGVLVRYPVEGTPAEEAGIKRGDIITTINGNNVDSPDVLRNTVAGMPPGEEVSVEVFRSGKTLKFTIKLAVLPERTASLTPARPGGDTTTTPAQDKLLRKLGLEKVSGFKPTAATPRTPNTAKAGVMIEEVRVGSVAHSKGLIKGMVITHVQNVAVKSPAELVKQLDKHDLSKGVRISVQAGDQPVYVLLELNE